LPDHPKFVFNATNMASGGIWSFSTHYMGDPLIGKQHDPDLSLAEVVNACTAVPILTQFLLRLDPAHIRVPASLVPPDENGLVQLPLSDGGFADPMALESAWDRHASILVSDGTAWDPMSELRRFDWASSAAA
jgi:NTE family protein